MRPVGCYQLIRLMDAYAALAPAEHKGGEAKVEKMRMDIQGGVAGMQGVLHDYRRMLRTISEMDAARFENLAAVRLHFDHQDSFSLNIVKRLTVLHGHISSKTLGNSPHVRDDLEKLRDILPD